LPSASGGGGGHIDSPTHAGVPLGLGTTVPAAVGLGGTLVLTGADDFVEVGPDVPGAAACCDPQAISPAHPNATTAHHREPRPASKHVTCHLISVTQFARDAVVHSNSHCDCSGSE
jgi:hypothetical protein